MWISFTQHSLRWAWKRYYAEKKSWRRRTGTINWKKYLAEKPAPIVRGLNNAFYLTDHHHLAVALANAHVKDSKKEMHAILKADFSDSKSSGEFWRRMQDHGFV